MTEWKKILKNAQGEKSKCPRCGENNSAHDEEFMESYIQPSDMPESIKYKYKCANCGNEYETIDDGGPPFEGN